MHSGRCAVAGRIWLHNYCRLVCHCCVISFTQFFVVVAAFWADILAQSYIDLPILWAIADAAVFLDTG